MLRMIVNESEDDPIVEVEVGEEFRAWNLAIGAKWGEVVTTSWGGILWVDEEGRYRNGAVVNRRASAIAGQPIYGKAILFAEGDIE